MDDREAIDRLRRGDIGGLEVLVRRYQTQAIRAAYVVTRDRPLAEDVVQTAFLRAYERIGQFDVERPFGPWFLRSVVNDAIKAAARGQRQASLDQQREGDEMAWAELLGDPHPGPEALLERAETCQAVHRALARLSPQQRATVVLRYFLGLGEAEISQQLGCPRGTVKRRLHDARERLRTLLSALLPERADQTPAHRPAPAEAQSYPAPHLTQEGEKP